MSGMLGLASLTSPVHVLIPYGFASPPVDIIKGSVAGSQIGVLPDGTQLWRIFHNGVDSHTIHTHLFNSQLINRNGQDGIMLPPDPTELGWKDTFRINPLEVTYLAMRPIIPTPAQVPFQVPNSVRLIDPTMPEGAVLTPPAPAGWFDPAGNGIAEILNHYVNFGWEYVWHCHILAHEEMDMMHGLAFAVPPMAPSNLVATLLASPVRVRLTWTDNSLNETGVTIQRATDSGFTTGLTTFTVGADVATFTDTSVVANTTYYYRVVAGNLVGDTATAGFPVMNVDSAFSNTAVVGGATYSISGRVRTAGGTPIAAVTMTLSGAATGSTTTDALGRYIFSGLGNGSYIVTPSKTGYTFNPTSRNVIVSGVNVTGQNFTGTVAVTYSIQGRVLTLTGTPVAGVTMTLSGAATGSTATDALGRYRFTAVNGNYTITPSMTGFTFTPASRNVTVSNANVTGVNFRRN